MTVAASEAYNTAFEAAPDGAGSASPSPPGPDTAGGREPVREITGVPAAMIEFFSRRRAAIEARYAELVRDYRTEHGHDPDAGAVPPAGPAGQPRHPAGQEAAPLPGRQAGRVARGTDRSGSAPARSPG